MKKKIFLFLIFATFLIGSFCFAQRELEVEYPELGIPGIEAPTVTRTVLTDFIRYIFTLAITIAGLLAFGALIYGGIRYLTSAGDPTKMSDGKDQAMAGVLGLIILLSSYLILNTINPQLVLKEAPTIESLEQGIYAYVKTGCVDDPDDSLDDPILLSQSSPNLSVELSQSLQCIEFLSGKEELTVGVCSGTDFGEPCDFYEGDSGETKNVTGESIKMNYHLPGVYLYVSNNCTGDDYKIYQASSATLPEFDDKTNSIMFIYGGKDDISGEYKTKYAAVLHENENFMGQAALFDQEQGKENCKNLSENLYGGPAGIAVSSITVYLKPVGEPTGEGVKFWGDKNYTNEKDDFELGYYEDGETMADLEEADDKITSMEMIGPYVALLFREPDFSGDCEVFMSSCPDFRSHRIGQCGFMGRSDCLSSFIIKARK